jgi:hypothetical protein
MNDELWGLLCETEATLPEADKAPLNDYDMICDIDIEQRAGGDDLARDKHILGATLEQTIVARYAHGHDFTYELQTADWVVAR